MSEQERALLGSLPALRIVTDGSHAFLPCRLSACTNKGQVLLLAMGFAANELCSTIYPPMRAGRILAQTGCSFSE